MSTRWWWKRSPTPMLAVADCLPAGPASRRLVRRCVQLVHLQNRYRRVSRPISPSSIAAALHPTPAVAGLPRREGVPGCAAGGVRAGAITATARSADRQLPGPMPECGLAIRSAAGAVHQLELDRRAGCERSDTGAGTCRRWPLKLGCCSSQLKPATHPFNKRSM